MMTIKFDEKEHKYTFGDKTFISVTQLVKKFFKPFYADEQAESFALKNGMEKQEVLDMWQKKADFGTKVHKYAEMRVRNPQISHDIFINETSQSAKDHYLQINKFVNLIEPLDVEKIVWSELYEVAGTVDLIARYQDKICLMDYKTNVITKYGFEYGYSVCSSIKNSKYNIYSLQLSLYRYLMELKGWKIPQLYLIQISETGFEMIEVPYLKKEIEEMLKIHTSKKEIITMQKILTKDEKIRVAQCFNLAHAEGNRDNLILHQRTKQLYTLLNQIEEDIENGK